MTILERFNAKYIPVTESGCWLWIGCLNWQGYGQFSRNGKGWRAHRAAYEMFRGPIPEGLEIDHLCRVRCCVNPDHLEIVDHRTNTLRGVTVTGANAVKTHCHRGHELSGSNLYVSTEGWRVCRICQIKHDRKRRQRERDEHVRITE